MGILNILFGRRTKIFDENGAVHHDLGSSKWTEWNNRLKKNPDYDWRSHKGRVGETKTVKTEESQKKDKS